MCDNPEQVIATYSQKSEVQLIPFQPDELVGSNFQKATFHDQFIARYQINRIPFGKITQSFDPSRFNNLCVFVKIANDQKTFTTVAHFFKDQDMIIARVAKRKAIVVRKNWIALSDVDQFLKHMIDLGLWKILVVQF